MYRSIKIRWNCKHFPQKDTSQIVLHSTRMHEMHFCYLFHKYFSASSWEVCSIPYKYHKKFIILLHFSFYLFVFITKKQNQRKERKKKGYESKGRTEKEEEKCKRIRCFCFIYLSDSRDFPSNHYSLFFLHKVPFHNCISTASSYSF